MTAAETRGAPCHDCPWRRASTKGWLGPGSIEDWLELVVSDEPIMCHLLLPAEEIQCRGAAIFRANICKSPRDRSVAVGPRDTETVFATPPEFREHHDAPLQDFLQERRANGEET